MDYDDENADENQKIIQAKRNTTKKEKKCVEEGEIKKECARGLTEQRRQ